MKKINAQSGQTLLIVILIMVVALTVGLAVVSRTITNLKVSKQNEESQRAFQAAEGGIEEALKKAAGSAVSLGNSSQYTSSYSKQAGNQVILNGGEIIDQDKGTDLWLSDYSQDSTKIYLNPQNPVNFEISWGTTGQTQCTSGGTPDNITPALEVVLLYSSATDPKVAKYVLDGCGGPGSPRTAGAEYIAPSLVTITDPNFPDKPLEARFSKTISIVGEPGFIAKVIPLYNSTKIGVKVGAGVLPAQGVIVTSTGKSGDSERKIVYFESFPQIPTELFPYAILSQ